MIRGQSESDFPDVDQMLEEADAPKSVLGYYGPDPDREPESDLLPLYRFARRAAFVGGLAALAGGLGQSINGGGDGASLMALGGALLGLILPIPGARRPNAW